MGKLKIITEKDIPRTTKLSDKQLYEILKEIPFGEYAEINDVKDIFGVTMITLKQRLKEDKDFEVTTRTVDKKIVVYIKRVV